MSIVKDIPFNVRHPQNNPDIYQSKNVLLVNAIYANCPFSKPDSHTAAMHYTILNKFGYTMAI